MTIRSLVFLNSYRGRVKSHPRMSFSMTRFVESHRYPCPGLFMQLAFYATSFLCNSLSMHLTSHASPLPRQRKYISNPWVLIYPSSSPLFFKQFHQIRTSAQTTPLKTSKTNPLKPPLSRAPLFQTKNIPIHPPWLKRKLELHRLFIHSRLFNSSSVNVYSGSSPHVQHASN